MKQFNLRPYFFIITILIVTITACQPALVEEAADTLVTQPENTQEPTMPPTNAYTNVPEVDEAIAIILSNNLADKRTIVEYTTVGCTNADGLGGPPKCEAGVAEGTAITYFPVLGPGEGHPVLPGNIDQTLDFTVTELAAVYRPSPETYRSPDYPIGEYSLVFARTGDETPVTVQLTNGRMIRLDFSPYPLDFLLQNINGEILFNRYPQPEAAPTATQISEASGSQETAVPCLPRTDWPTYIIAAGDTLYNLARNANTTVTALTEANCLENPENLLPGQTIYLPERPLTPTPPPTPTPTPDLNAAKPEILNFAIDVPAFRPGPGEKIRVIWESTGSSTQICFNYALNIYNECYQVAPAGVLTHTLKGDDPVADHWLDVTLEARNTTSSTTASERVKLHCHNQWFADGISEWCPTLAADGSFAQAQWFEGGLIIHANHSAMVIFEEPGTPCLAYSFLPNLSMDTSFLQPPDGRFLPDPALGKLYLGQFRLSETIRPRLEWATSELLEFAWETQCEETPTGLGQCFASAPDGRVYKYTAVAGAPQEEGIAVGSGVCPFVN